MLDFDNVEDAQGQINNIMLTVVRWMSERKLKLNTDKTEIILFDQFSSSIRDLPISFNVCSSAVKIASEVRNLGFTLDTKLNMEPQICKVKRKAIFSRICYTYINH